MAIAFHHQPLRGSEIRVITFSKTPLFGEEIYCEVENLPLDDSLRFYALSYVWGDPKERVPITLQCSKFEVTKNLFHALRQFREWVKGGDFADETGPGETPKFWADAICINQDDSDEKARQVPRMKDIYGSAIRVYGWLGLQEELDDRLVGLVFQKANEIAAHPRAHDMQWLQKYPIMDDLGQEYHAFTEAFLSIIQRPWFERIWIIQESVLAQTDPLFVIGPHFTNALGALSLIYTRLLAEAGDPRQELIVRRNLGPIKILRLRHYCRSLWTRSQNSSELSAFARMLNGILRDTTLGYVSTLPHDMIYALLGMALCPGLPAPLAPDYQNPSTKSATNTPSLSSRTQRT